MKQPSGSASKLSIKQVARSPEPFGVYNYEIYRGPTLVARYWHDYRGDECWVVFLDGREEEVPSGTFLTGGGPQPLGLSDVAIHFLTERLASGA